MPAPLQPTFCVPGGSVAAYTGATVLLARWMSSFTLATRARSKENVTAPFVTAGVTTKRVTVRSIKLHRDIFYTHGGMGNNTFIYYVQPGHYMCMGDNSAQSSDSRAWGTVPRMNIYGKAVFVYWPLGKMGRLK